MTRARHLASPPPRLVDVYAEAPGNGVDVHREYLRRWDAWHATFCGRPECLRHAPRIAPHRKESQS